MPDRDDTGREDGATRAAWESPEVSAWEPLESRGANMDLSPGEQRWEQPDFRRSSPPTISDPPPSSSLANLSGRRAGLQVARTVAVTAVLLVIVGTVAMVVMHGGFVMSPLFFFAPWLFLTMRRPPHRGEGPQGGGRRGPG
jgi:hypothetical protein